MNLNHNILNSKISSNNPLIISGPCSAESQKQLLDIAFELKKLPINVFRAGIWKPRTRPNGFEGFGLPALEWLKNVKYETGFKVITEVANPYHLEKILEYEIDMIWIGARTTGNPFAVQEIADAIKGIDIPVFIKNPMIPDINLWIGAIERLYNSGLNNIYAIHRGFYNHSKEKYRNIPQWNLPLTLKDLVPSIPVICDPSHIAGKKEFVEEISLQALNLNFEGLMIETHTDPKNALTDQLQQLKPADLKIIIENFKKESIINF